MTTSSNLSFNAVMIAHAGEIGIKSKSTRTHMIKLLHNSIINKLDLKHSSYKAIKNISNRSILHHPNAEAIAFTIAEIIFGVSYSAPIYFFTWESYDRLIETLFEFSISNIQAGTSFGLDAKCSGKNRVSTTKLKTELGQKIVDHFNGSVSVNLSDPDIKLITEVRGENAWIDYNKFKGLDGFPQSSQKNLVFGLIKPWYMDYVSSFLIMKRGVDVQVIRFLTDENSNQIYETIHTSFISDFSNHSSIDIPIYDVLQKWQPLFKEKLCTACTLFSQLLILPLIKEENAVGYINGLQIAKNQGDITIPVLTLLDSTMKQVEEKFIQFRPCLFQSYKLNNSENPANASCCNLVNKRKLTSDLDQDKIDLVKETAKLVSHQYLNNRIKKLNMYLTPS